MSEQADRKLVALQQALEQMRTRGRKLVLIEDFIAAIDQLRSAQASTSTGCSVEYYKAQVQTQLAEYDARVRFNEAMFHSVIATGQTALKVIMLINGGAAVALLAFFGQAVARGLDISRVASAQLCFTLGVFSAAVAAVTTYFSQACYGDSMTKRGHMWRWTTLIFGGASLGLFLAGSATACRALFVLALSS